MLLKDWRIVRHPVTSSMLVVGGLLLGLAVARVGGTASGQPADAGNTQSGTEAASVFGDVDECDLLAAHPADPQRVADGVSDAAIVPRLALRACESAVRQQPNEPRFAYQLGRALTAVRRTADARKQFERAAQGNYAAAVAAYADIQLETGDALMALMSAPRPSNSALTQPELAQMARQVLRDTAGRHDRAARAGFAPSEQRAAALTFLPGAYTHPVLGQIVNADLDAANAYVQRADARAYLYSFSTNLMGQCGPVLDAATVARLVALRFTSTPDEQEDSLSVSTQPLVGEIDVQRFIRRHGCEGQVMTLFADGMRDLLNQTPK